MRRVILASGSEWRAELLTWLGVEFEVMESGFDEGLVQADEAEELVASLAAAKARQVAKGVKEGVVVGGDTVVVVDGEVIGKPRDLDHAKEILLKLRGRDHRVLTGVAVIEVETGECRVEVEETRVKMSEFGEKELKAYLETGESMGTAGGYRITGGAERFVEDLEGSFTNVVGLPLVVVTELLEGMGVIVPVDPREVIMRRTKYSS